MTVFALFSALTATCGSYAFLMSIVKKEHNATWLRGEAVLTLLASGLALAVFGKNLFTSDLWANLTTTVLLLAVGNAFALFLFHHTSMKNDKATYPETIVATTRLLGVITFATLCLFLLLFVFSYTTLAS